MTLENIVGLHFPGVEAHEFARLVPLKPIIVAYRGSIAHGTHVPPEEPTGLDDRDIIVAYIPPLVDYFGPAKVARGKDVKIREWDSAAYEVRHLVKLLCGANPNIMSCLWTPPIHAEREGQMLIDARSLFATKVAYHSFMGYARGQMYRMTARKEEVSDCGCSGIFHGEDCAMKDELGRGSSKRFATGFMGAKRKGLVEKFGYDVKNAAHCIRLLRMGTEFLRTGELTVDRRKAGDAAELIAIKRGEWSLGVVKALADELFKEAESEYEKSPLPEAPNMRHVSQLLMDMLCLAHGTEVTLQAHDANLRATGLRTPISTYGDER
jgi:hypothetical protein